MESSTDILLIPGLESTGLLNHERTCKLSSPLQAIARQTHGKFKTTSFLGIRHFDTMVNRLQQAMLDDPDLILGKYTAVATSFGAWVLFKALCRQKWYPGHAPFRHIVVIDPYTEAKTEEAKVPRILRRPARTTGFPRFASKGVKGFWIPGSLVRDMLDNPDNNLYDGRLGNLTGSEQRITIVSTGRGYTPETTATFAAALGIAKDAVLTPAGDADTLTTGEIHTLLR